MVVGPVERFWCPRDGTFALDSEGYLADPVDEHLPPGTLNQQALGTNELVARRCLILLGEPGAGKSTFVAEKHPIVEGPCLSVFFDLALYGSEDRVVREILEGEVIADWMSGTGQLCLVLDSLDEVKARVPQIAGLLSERISKWPCERLFLRIACRTADWPATLEQALGQVFPEVTVVEILPLRRVDALAIATEFCDPGPFLDAVLRAGAVPLASRPLTLRLLGRDYARTGRLPDRPSDLYFVGVRSLCEEWSPGRREAGLEGQLSVDERLSVARRLAAATIFGGQTSFRTNKVGDPPSNFAIDDVIGGSEPGPNGNMPVTLAAVREVARTGLFTARGTDRLGWAHSTFADYLAAEWVVSNGLSPQKARPLFCGPDGHAWPQTRLTAAWVVAIAPDQFAWLAIDDPESFRGEVDLPGDALRKAVVDGLFSAANRLTHSWGESYSGLNHPEIANQLRSRLRDPQLEIRRLALEITRDCRISELRQEILAITLDVSADLSDRVRAGWVVVETSENDPTAELLPLAVDASARGEDPLDELKGVGFLASWPHALSTKAVLDLLSSPKRRNFSGSYALFLDRLAGNLESGDLDAGLGWLERTASNLTDHRLARVANAVVRLAAIHIVTPGIAERFARIAIARSDQYEGLFFEDFGDDFDPLEQAEVRRKVLSALLLITKDEGIFYRVGGHLAGHDRGLVRAGDLSWLAHLYVDADSQTRPLLAKLFSWNFDMQLPEHIELVLSLAKDHPLYQDLVQEWVEPVRLDSPQVKALRETWTTLRRSASDSEGRTDEINARIISLLGRFDQGEAIGFWQSSRLLTVKPGSSQAAEFDPDISGMPRWETFTNSERSRLVEAAETYLRRGGCAPDEWMEDPNTRYHPAEAGYRAFLMLLREAPDRLRGLPKDVWEEWAPILIAWSCTANGAKWEDKKALLDIADPFAHLALVGALIRRAVVSVANHHRLGVDREADYLWGNDVAAEYLRLASASPDPPRREFVETLSRNARDLVRPLLREWLADAEQDDAKRELAARVLADYDLGESWPFLKVAFEKNLALAMVAFGQSTTMRFRRNGLEMPEDMMADLYEWLKESFPPYEDPEFDDVHVVGPRETLGEWRDHLLVTLRDSGTPAAVKAIRRLAANHPQEAWLVRTLAKAETALRQTQWEPISLRELLRLATESRVILVHDHADLLAVLIQGLADIQERLTGATPESQLLWDTRSRRPKTEDEISDYLKNRLTDFIGGRGIAVNREVQIRRTQPSGIGNRTDLLLDAAIAKEPSSASIITLPIEVKGAWNSDLMTGLTDQLVGNYMRDIGSGHGVYLVAWPDIESWDATDPNRATVAAMDRASVLAALNAQAAAQEEEGLMVKVIALDISYRRPTDL